MEMKTNLIFLIACLIAISTITTSCQKQTDSFPQINSLQTSLLSLQKRCDSLATALNKTNVDLQSSNSNVSNLSISITSFQTQVTSIINQITSINSQLTSSNVNITAIGNQINVLNQEYTTLLSLVNNLTSSQRKYYVTITNLNYAKAEVIDTSKWHYVAVLFHSDLQTEVYIDGIKEIDYYRPNLNYNYSSLFLGTSFYTSFTRFFKGYLDEIRVSNIVRTQKEIQDYYTRSMGSDGVTLNSAQTLDNSTIGLWHLNESSGTVIANAVQNASSGSLTGGFKFVTGKSGNAVYFNGIDAFANCNINIPESPISIEFWFKSTSIPPTYGSTMIQPYGMYSNNINYDSGF